jgi:D-alanine-D-alanine ligase
MKKRIAVLMGGPSAEFTVSLSTGQSIIKHLDKKEFSVSKVLIDQKKNWFIDDKPVLLKEVVHFLKNEVWFCFLALHGRFGEDGTIQGFLETLEVAYSGSRVLASALAMDKHKTLTLLEHAGLPVPQHIFLESSNKIDKLKIKFPCVVLPNNSGSSVGVSICFSEDVFERALKKAFSESSAIIISQYLKGMEISVPILGEGYLPIIEIIPKTSKFYDYKAKYQEGGSQHIIPARLPKAIYKKAGSLALLVHKLIGCRAYSRVDMIIANDKPYILEINTLPGMTPTSLLPQAALKAGISYPELLKLMIHYSLTEKT